MRLLNTTTLELSEFLPGSEPRYAILSHTWGADEVTFADMTSSTPAALQVRRAKQGWAKIEKTCELARAAGLTYAWVDTCCIDKASSAELSESINSMFAWYRGAARCLVFLADLHPKDGLAAALPRCRWVTRGWTLQELLAPADVRFLDAAWRERGSKRELAAVIHACTGIAPDVLLGERRLASVSVAARMAWAARRTTTRPEDLAYCLLGIFDVHMPLLYGEGMRAFRRLQEEITRRSSDLTILCWDAEACRQQVFHGLLAPHPSAFAGMGRLETLDLVGESFAVTNSGLRLTNTLHYPAEPVGKRGQYYVLLAGYHEANSRRRLAMVRLRKMDVNTFYRQGALLLEDDDEGQTEYEDYMGQDYYILLDEPVYTPLARLVASPRMHAVHIPSYMDIKAITPHDFWDVEDRLFLDIVSLRITNAGAVHAVKAHVCVRGSSLDLVVLLDRRAGDAGAVCRIYEARALARETRWLFAPKWKSQWLYWTDVEFHAPALLEVSNTLAVGAGLGVTRIAAALRRGIVPSVSTAAPVFSLVLEETLEAAERKKAATWR